MKECRTCKSVKSLDQYSKHKKRKDGLQPDCKDCNRVYKAQNKEAIDSKNKNYRLANKDVIAERNKKYFSENKQTISEIHKRYNEGNKERLNYSKRKYRAENKERVVQWRRNHIEKNKERIAKHREENKERIAKYKEENKEYITDRKRKQAAKYARERRQNDPIYYFKSRIRHTVRQGLFRRSVRKKSRTTEILGCSFEELRVFIEQQFRDGMSWANMSQWHIDHKIPLASAKTESEVIALNHYTNLQPLWAADNIKKGSKILNENKGHTRW